MRLALKPVAPDAQAREALAKAIVEAQKLQAAADKARQAFERAQKFVVQVQTEYEATAEALGKAVAEEGERIAAALSTGAPTGSGNAVRAARQKVADGEDGLAAAKAAMARLRDAVVDPADDARRAQERVREATAAVVEIYADDMLSETMRLQAQLGERRAVLREVRCMLDYRTEKYKKIENFLIGRPFPIEFAGTFDRCTSVGEWRRAMDALAKDASAPVPAPAGGR